MKKLLKRTAFIAVLAVCILAAHLAPLHRHKTIAPITPERKATHMITFYTDSDHRAGLCTGTAVGPHAILTATHCTEDGYKIISFDLSVKKYHIIGSITDGSDHTIIHVDGPAFTNIVTIKERKAVLGETVTSYGDGAMDFPQHTYYGKVVEQQNGGDTSELDRRDGINAFSLPVIPGDSGSAIYGTDGDIVALVTYSDTNEEENIHQAVGFELSFTPEQLALIARPDAAPTQLDLNTPHVVTLDDLIHALEQ